MSLFINIIPYNHYNNDELLIIVIVYSNIHYNNLKDTI